VFLLPPFPYFFITLSNPDSVLILGVFYYAPQPPSDTSTPHGITGIRLHPFLLFSMLSDLLFPYNQDVTHCTDASSKRLTFLS